MDAEHIKNYVDENFQQFGKTRRQEITRLLFEIAKREKCNFLDVIQDYFSIQFNFDQLKAGLIKRRYPRITQKHKRVQLSLPELKVNPSYRVDTRPYTFSLTNIYYEESIKTTEVVKRLKREYPNVKWEMIVSYSQHTRSKKYGIGDYNKRNDSFYLIREKFDFLKSCPCSNHSLHCGYHIINLGSGCAFDCNYCYLQDYINSPGIVIPANLEDFFDKFKAYNKDIRIGSGELTDSLIFDHITEYSPQIVNFFKDYPKSYFEFKTKSNNIKRLISVSSGGNIIVSWSVNPQKIIDACEHHTASLRERLQAAKECVEAGYQVAFHFDPVIYYDGWEEEYKNLVDVIFDCVKDTSIYTISLGTLRMTPRLKTIIENRFPDNSILDEEMFPGHDGKLRYADEVRAKIYNNMLSWIRKRSSKVHVYLCMEDKQMCTQTQAAPLRKYSKRAKSPAV